MSECRSKLGGYQVLLRGIGLALLLLTLPFAHGQLEAHDAPNKEGELSFPSLTIEQDKASPVNSRFRLSAELLAPLKPFPSDANEVSVEQHRRLGEIDGLIWNTMFWEMNQNSAHLDFDDAIDALDDPRRFYLHAYEADWRIPWNGLDGYISNRGDDVRVAAEAFRRMGCIEESTALKRASEIVPFDENGFEAFPEYPWPEDVSSELAELENQFYGDDFGIADKKEMNRLLRRVEYALKHQELFFTSLDIRYIPNKEGRGWVPEGGEDLVKYADE